MRSSPSSTPLPRYARPAQLAERKDRSAWNLAAQLSPLPHFETTDCPVDEFSQSRDEPDKCEWEKVSGPGTFPLDTQRCECSALASRANLPAARRVLGSMSATEDLVQPDWLDWVQRAQQGDLDAFGRLVGRFQDSAVAY